MLQSARDDSLRRQLEARERASLSPSAALSSDSRGRLRPEPADPIRPAFQRDRDRIVHSKAFRRLKHKTQVFLAPTGDHYRTRLTHTLEVSQIARTIAKVLLLNEELTEAIALGHDLGHAPFGHAGERVLTRLCPGGFNHYEQSLRVVDVIEQDGAGLNLTWEVRDGISKHSKGKHGAPVGVEPALRAATLEGQVARVADLIAYVNHDIDDAVRAGILQVEALPVEPIAVLGATSSERIGCMVADVVRETLAQQGDPEVAMSPRVLHATLDLRAFLHADGVRERRGGSRVRQGVRHSGGALGEGAGDTGALSRPGHDRARRAGRRREGLPRRDDRSVRHRAVRGDLRTAALGLEREPAPWPVNRRPRHRSPPDRARPRSTPLDGTDS